MAAGSTAIVLYYSRTGNCRAAARAIGETLSCPVREIRDLKNRAGFWGFISGMIDIRRRPITDIAPAAIDLSPYDTVFLGSPVWGMRFAPAMTTALETFDFSGKRVVLFAVVSKQFKQAQLDAYARALTHRGARAGASFVIKTMRKAPDLIRQEAKKALAGITNNT